LRGKRTVPEGKVETTTMDNPKNMITEELMNEADHEQASYSYREASRLPITSSRAHRFLRVDTRKVAIHSSKHRAALLNVRLGFELLVNKSPTGTTWQSQ
jgi:hypothetical protein